MSVRVFNGWTSNSIPFTDWNFPGGEVGVKLSPFNLVPNAQYYVEIYDIPHPRDIFVALMLADALRNVGVPKENLTLLMEYLPYARQDRICNEGESFSLKVFVNMLKGQDSFGKILCSDLHSKVSTELLMEIPNVQILQYPQVLLFNMIRKLSNEPYDFIVSPDQGAMVKASLIRTEVPHIFLTKERKGATVSYVDYTEQDLNGKSCIVVDDICDGGATFIGLAEMLKRNHPTIVLDLYVSHGIFSKGTDALKKYYRNIYTYNLMSPNEKGNVNVNQNISYKSQLPIW